MVMPQALRTCSITSGFSGSPAEMHSRIWTLTADRSAWISIRQTVVGRRAVVVEPVVHGFADGDADAVVGDALVPAGVGAAGDDGPYAATRDPVREVGVGEQRGRGDHHGAGPDAAEHCLPQGDGV